MTVPYVIAVAVVLRLLLFFFNEVRRSPGPREWGRTPRWAKRVRVSLATIILALACLGFYAFFIEPNRLIVRNETVQIESWPTELDGLRIAVLSDLHIGGWFVRDKKLRLIVDRTNQLQPDLIVILGDYMTGQNWKSDRVEPEVFGPLLRDFRAPLGVYSVLGNHDWWWDGKRVRQGLEANGIRVLDDEVFEVHTRGTSFWLAGLADLWTRPQHIKETVARTPEGKPVIALTHNPDIFPNVPQRVSLLLAGHTHGGQVWLPLIGTVVQASNVDQRYAYGHLFDYGHHLFVTTGIGTSIMPVRFGVPPEIVLLTVKSR